VESLDGSIADLIFGEAAVQNQNIWIGIA